MGIGLKILSIRARSKSSSLDLICQTCLIVKLERGITPMSIQAHINSLAEKRAHIKMKIAQESARPSPDFVLITDLKKQNLTLKEEMQRYLIVLHEESSSAG